jgi:hypothetical protein
MTQTASEILRKHGINSPSTAIGRHYTVCKCSKDRKGAHKTAKVLGITIDADGVSWGCNHCGWTGGEKYKNGSNGGGVPYIYFEYLDRDGSAVGRKVRDPRPGKNGEKIFWWQRPDGNGRWTKGGGAKKVL